MTAHFLLELAMQNTSDSSPAIIMVAPNGARKNKQDHQSLPLTIPETVQEAVKCHKAGASVIHAHVRDDNENHTLDTGRYRELLSELKIAAPDLLVQITTEAVGIYTPEQQAQCVKEVMPLMASVSIREMTENFTEFEHSKAFYHWAQEQGVHIQHIFYSAEDAAKFGDLQAKGVVPKSQRCVLFVLGRYSKNFQSDVADLSPFLAACDYPNLIWFICAFGAKENACVREAIRHGGHARVGFENNLLLPDGNMAASSEELISLAVAGLQEQGRTLCSPADAREILGTR